MRLVNTNIEIDKKDLAKYINRHKQSIYYMKKNNTKLFNVIRMAYIVDQFGLSETELYKILKNKKD